MAITDGSVVCGHCGEWRTTCPLCIGEERLVDMTSTLARQAREDREAEREMDRQSAAIRSASTPQI